MIQRYAVFVLLLSSACGCGGVGVSRIFNPGPAWYQQNQAERFDPFPAVDVAPDIQARPLAYNRPAPLNERYQNADSFVDRYHQPPPPGIYRAPRTTTTQENVPFTPLPAPDAPPMFAP